MHGRHYGGQSLNCPHNWEAAGGNAGRFPFPRLAPARKDYGVRGGLVRMTRPIDATR
jgi:hypothetical protein